MCCRSLPLRAVLPTGARTEIATWLQLRNLWLFEWFWKWTSTLWLCRLTTLIYSCCGFLKLSQLSLDLTAASLIPFGHFPILDPRAPWGAAGIQGDVLTSGGQFQGSDWMKMKHRKHRSLCWFRDDLSILCKGWIYGGFGVWLLDSWTNWRVQYRTIQSQFI